MDNTTAPTLETNEVAINIDADGNIFINESQVIGANVAASNGVIHVIDRVLLPPANGGSARLASDGFEVIAHPNPATDRVTINSLKEEFADNTNVVIYHSRGDVFYEGQLNNTIDGKLNINVANYPTGVYIIKLQSGNQNKDDQIIQKVIRSKTHTCLFLKGQPILVGLFHLKPSGSTILLSLKRIINTMLVCHAKS